MEEHVFSTEAFQASAENVCFIKMEVTRDGHVYPQQPTQSDLNKKLQIKIEQLHPLESQILEKPKMEVIHDVHECRQEPTKSDFNNECQIQSDQINPFKKIAIKIPTKTRVGRDEQYQESKRTENLSIMSITSQSDMDLSKGAIQSPKLVKKRPKTLAERSRDYRARKKAEQQKMQQNSSNESSQSSTLNAQSNHSDKKRAKTTLERARAFRARKKAKKIEMELQRFLSNESSHLRSDTLKYHFELSKDQRYFEVLKKRAKTSLERTRDCRARKKAKKLEMELQRISSNESSQSSTLNAQSHCDTQTKVVECSLPPELIKKRAKAAEWARNYRAKQKAEKQNMTIQQISSDESFKSITCNVKSGILMDVKQEPNPSEFVEKRAKTSAERTREYRARKKATEQNIEMQQAKENKGNNIELFITEESEKLKSNKTSHLSSKPSQHFKDDYSKFTESISQDSQNNTDENVYDVEYCFEFVDVNKL